MLEKIDGRGSAHIRRGSFSGGVSVPLISPSAPEASGFLRNESIEVCRCISDVWRRRWTAARACGFRLSVGIGGKILLYNSISSSILAFQNNCSRAKSVLLLVNQLTLTRFYFWIERE